MTTTPCDVCDLRRGPVSASLREIMGRPSEPPARCTLALADGMLRVLVEAADPDMSNLAASISAPNKDRFLFEEDCVQVAVADNTAAVRALLVNPRGTRAGGPGSDAWQASVARDARGWSVEVRLPWPGSAETLGLSVHRFFRGIRGQMQGLAQILPHPLEPARFHVLVGAGTRPAAQAAADHAASVSRAEQAALEARLADLRRRLAAAAAGPGPRPSLGEAVRLARARAAEPLRADERYLSWNEAHLHWALADLWELTGDAGWIETAVRRMEGVWALTGEARGVPDSMWGRPLPTWYNTLETGTTCTLTSGAVLYPITRVMRLVQGDARLARFRPAVEAWLPRALAIVELHEPEWVDWPDGSGMHLEPYGKGPARAYPRGGSRVNPLNREFFFSLAVLDLAHLTGDARLRRRVEQNALFFKRVSERAGDGCLLWEYEQLPYPACGEDIDHAACQVLFAERCAADGVAFAEEDLARIGATFERRIFRHGDVPCGTVRGLDPGIWPGVASWASLCRFAPHLFPRVEAVIAASMVERPDLFREGWGARVLASVERVRGALAATGASA